MSRKEKYNSCLFRLCANLAEGVNYADAFKELERLDELAETARERRIHDNMCEQVEEVYSNDFPEFEICL